MNQVNSFKQYLIRSWQSSDREAVVKIISSVLAEYGLAFDDQEADKDVVEIESYYEAVGGKFWVVEADDQIVGTAAYYPIQRGNNAVEIRKMYLLPSVRGQGLGKYLLKALEKQIKAQGYQEIWLETASCLQEATRLYEKNGYQLGQGVETARCDRVYVKQVDEI